MKKALFVSALSLFFGMVSSLYAAIETNTWHIPSNTADVGTNMRTPFVVAPDTMTATCYQGVWKGGGANQTGGQLRWKKSTDSTWNSVALTFHSNVGSNQFWKADLPLGSVGAGETVQYYFRVTFDNRSTTFVHGTDSSSMTTGTESVAEAAPFTFSKLVGLKVNNVNADYTTTKFFIDENAGESHNVTVELTLGSGTVTAAEVFTNLNRRDRAGLDANADGIEDGILPPDGNLIVAGNDSHYFKAYTMTNAGGGKYTLTLPANKTGAYRLTARYKYSGDTNWRWYSTFPLRDHAIVVSPKKSLDIVMYELNTLNIEASGTLPSQRSTFEDLWDGPGALHTNPTRVNQWNLDYLKGLGVNWIWFQPIHPYGIEGRHLSAQDIMNRQPGVTANTWVWNGGAPYEDVNYPFALGSPYAVKNFFEIEPRMSANYNPSDSIALQRSKAMTSFQNFAIAAHNKGIYIMLDAAFNHTAHDVEAGDLGVTLGFGSTPTTLIRDHEARFFSRLGDYSKQATSAANIAPAPDRGDFGKWLDVKDVFFGVYAALVKTNPADDGAYYNAGDWFDYTVTTGSFNAQTRNVWKYFAEYLPYWLQKTGGRIDGLRCDFGQGLPPQAWEYIINKARTAKWDVVFMAETLDGGSGEGTPGYRSNRHFDILNENLLFSLKNTDYDATDPITGKKTRPEQPITSSALRSFFEQRRAAYGFGLILLNTSSHDEDNYVNPWHALSNHAAAATFEGAPMVFPGQELGISKMYGYDLMEQNFGKYVPHFKTYNSMMPLWANTDFGNDQLYHVYSGIHRARAMSKALRAHNRYFINRTGTLGVQEKIHSVAKYEAPNASPAVSDVVFAFVNLDVTNTTNNPQSGTFDVNITQNGSNLFGIQNSASKKYNVVNIAAYNGQDPTRSTKFLWTNSRTGQDILANGIFVSLNAVPTTVAGWTTAPYEPQYLKLMDMDADQDGDGFTNEQEKTLGSNPFDPLSPAGPPVITSITTTATTATIQWTSVGGVTYKIQSKNDLNDPTWTEIGSVTATGTASSFTDTSASGMRKFYRIVIP